MDEIIIVLPNLIYTKFEIKNWGQALPEIKVGGPRPMRPIPVPPPIPPLSLIVWPAVGR